ncbi:hypothetical protein [Rhizobium leguminosarum]|uniref:hypothetical protein n=1 Tax=Rhizobium leguminosarum TaxID=384 RepID=UPI0021BBD5D0|nr:hypothetical protein [Rhizobium leguminosarum]
MSAAALEALEEAERAFNAAMVSNDPIQIATCITQDGVLVTPAWPHSCTGYSFGDRFRCPEP